MSIYELVASFAKPIFEAVEGSPFQPGERVKFVQDSDGSADNDGELIGREGVVEYIEYSCGCGQSYPDDPMICVRFDNEKRQEFWKEELVRLEATAPQQQSSPSAR